MLVDYVCRVHCCVSCVVRREHIAMARQCRNIHTEQVLAVLLVEMRTERFMQAIINSLAL